MRAAYTQVEEILMKRLTEARLNESLDELIWLFTPARWAYEGLSVKPDLQDGRVSVEMLTAKTHRQAETRLNTAELNVIVLSLYMLCGPTIPNPLGTIILDDPLQNMDGLTSATLARGMAKIAALLPAGWQLMLMFHAEDDVEIFRREVPSSVYHLPWLGPIGVADLPTNDVISDSQWMSQPAGSKSLDTVLRLKDRKQRRGRNSTTPRATGEGS